MIPKQKTAVPVKMNYVIRRGSGESSLENETGEVVPGGLGDPREFILSHLGADETSWISGTQSSNSSNILISIVVNVSWNKPVTKRDESSRRSGQFNSIRSFETSDSLRSGRSNARND